MTNKEIAMILCSVALIIALLALLIQQPIAPNPQPLVYPWVPMN